MKTKNYRLLLLGLLLWTTILIASIKFLDFKNDFFVSGDGAIHYELLKLYAKSNCWICYIPNHCLGLLVPIFYPPFIFVFYKILFLLIKNTTVSFLILLLLPIYLFLWSLYELEQRDKIVMFFIGLASLFYTYKDYFGLLNLHLNGLIAQAYVILLGPLLLYFYIRGDIIGIILTSIVMFFSRPFDSLVFTGAISTIMLLDRKFIHLIVLLISNVLASIYYLVFVMPHSYRISQVFISYGSNMIYILIDLLKAMPIFTGILFAGFILFIYYLYKNNIDKVDLYFLIVSVISLVLSTGLVKILEYGHYYRYFIIATTYAFILSSRQFTKLKKQVMRYYLVPFLLILILIGYFNLEFIWNQRFSLEQYIIRSLPKFENTRLHVIPTFDYWKVFLPHQEEAYYIRNNENINCLYSESNPLYDIYIYANYKGSLTARWGRAPYITISNIYEETYPLTDFLKLFDKNLGVENVVIRYKQGLSKYWKRNYDYSFLNINSTNACLLRKPIWIVSSKSNFPILLQDFIINKKIRLILVTPLQYQKYKSLILNLSKSVVFVDYIDCDKNIHGYYIGHNLSCRYYRKISLADLYNLEDNSSCIDVNISISPSSWFSLDKYIKSKYSHLDNKSVLVLRYQYWDVNGCFLAEPFFFACLP